MAEIDQVLAILQRLHEKEELTAKQAQIWLRDVFDFHELDALLLDCERKRQNDRPVFFDFSIKRIIATNLEV